MLLILMWITEDGSTVNDSDETNNYFHDWWFTDYYISQLLIV